MFLERKLRSKRRGLNPTKIVFVYVVALGLVTFHQAGRLADWLDDLALNSSGVISDSAFWLSEKVRSSVVPHGPAQMNEVEDKLLAYFPPTLSTIPAQSPSLAQESLRRTHNYSKPTPRHRAQAKILPPTDLTSATANTPPSVIYQTPDTPPEITRPQEEPEEKPSLLNPKRVLLLGDSMMLEGLGPQLQRELKKNPGLEVSRDGRYGTGLVRLDAFDWLAYFDQTLAKYEPDLVIITIGANDTQDILNPEGPRKRITVATPEWNSVYSERVGQILQKAATRKATVFWVGLPIMGQEPYGQRAANINNLAQEVCSKAPNCHFWDSWLSVADDQGKFTSFLRDGEGKSLRIRAKDAIHLTEAGGRIMAEKFLSETAKWVDYRQKPQEAAPPSTPDVAPAASPPPLSFKAPAQPALAPVFADLRPLAPSAGDGETVAAAQTNSGSFAEHTFYSQIRKKNTPYFIAAPEGAGPFPVIFLLHGAWDGAETWAQHLGPEKLARLATDQKVVLVMPDGEPFGWYLDGAETAIESYLMQELLPLVFKEKNIDSQKVGVTGLSMGGHGALTLALKYPKIFKAVGSLSGITDLAAHSGSRKLNLALRLDRALGPAGEAGQNWAPFGAMGMTASHPQVWAGRPLILSVGRDDQFTVAENQKLHKLLASLKVEHIYLEDDGGHDWDYWEAQLPVQLEFLGRHLYKLESDR